MRGGVGVLGEGGKASEDQGFCNVSAPTVGKGPKGPSWALGEEDQFFFPIQYLRLPHRSNTTSQERKHMQYGILSVALPLGDGLSLFLSSAQGLGRPMLPKSAPPTLLEG